MNETTNTSDQGGRIFCGLQPLILHLKTVATKTADRKAFDEVYTAVEELYLLDASLSLVRYGFPVIDKEDLDRAIDFWRRGRDGN